MGRSRSYVSLVRRSRLRRKTWSEATGGSSDESSHAPCDTCAYRYPRDVGLRFTARWIESRREGVANGCAIRESVGSKPLPLEFEERASALRTTRRNASRSCSMPPKPRHGVGARFSQVGLAECRRKPMHGAGSCRLAFGPEQGGACENDHGRERSDSAEQGFSSRTQQRATREVSTGAKSSTGSERPLHDVPRQGASVNDEVDRSRRALRRVI